MWGRKEIVSRVRLPKRKCSRIIGDIWSNLNSNIIISGLGWVPTFRLKTNSTKIAHNTRTSVIEEAILHPVIILESIAEDSADVKPHAKIEKLKQEMKNLILYSYRKN